MMDEAVLPKVVEAASAKYKTNKMPIATTAATIWLLVNVDASKPMAKAEAPYKTRPKYPA